MRRHRRSLSLVVLACAAVLTGCGTRVELGSSAAQQDLARSDLGGVTSTPTTTAATTETQGPALPADGAPADLMPVTPDDSSSDSAGGSSGSSAPTLKPVTGTVLVGVATFSGAKSVAALGVANIPKVDGKSEYQDLANYINAHGGFGGRPIKLVTYAYPLLSTQSPTVQSQAACSMFTQDNHVEFVLADRASNTEVLTTCLAKAKVPLFQDSPSPQDGTAMKTAPIYYPSSPTAQRIVKNWFVAMSQLGYFTARSKNAVMYCNYLTYKAPMKTVPAAAAAVGVTVTETTPIDCTDTGADQGQVQSAVVRYKAEGISNVMILDSGSSLVSAMTKAANQGAYKPRYALTTTSVLSYSASNAPKGQLKGALAMGWWPYQDVDTPYQPKLNSASQECSDIYAKAGYEVTDRNTRAAIMWPCSLMFFARSVLKASHGSTSLAAIKAAVEGFGTSWVSSEAQRTSFSTTKHDGAGAYRGIGFNDSCSCFTYVNQTIYPMQ